ncbi:BTAD domain-containing putative transcriptional regulator [Streptomyces sp. x-80]|uniref:AfsR/SARP family transcriptional regulator n=1 Tax=Streptomyces sp. x-80 TaxID=2789282 RepID=UPI003980CB08
MGSPQRQAVLAALALRPGRAVSLAQLVDAVWGQELPAGPAATIRTYAWQLRKSFEGDPSAPGVLLSAGDGYRLAVSASAVDALRAESLAGQAARARTAGRPEEARGLLADALDLWHGQPLSGVPGPFAHGQRARLEELRLALLEERLELDLLLGEAPSALPGLVELTVTHPLRERPHALLMRALCGTGRRPEALTVFAAYRARLAEELGVDPGAQLTQLHLGILRGDLAPAPRPEPAERGPAGPRPLNLPATARRWLVPAQRPGPPSARRPVRPPAQLPAPPADFTGREDAASRLSALLTGGERPAPAIVLVNGMAGIGKTALALRVAHRVRAAYPDGQLYADLAGLSRTPADPAATLAAFLTALGVAPGAVPPGLDDRSRLLRSELDGRRVLLVLDDVRDAAQLRPLLPGSASCGVVVTSRTGLGGLPLTGRIALDVFRPEESLALLGAVAGPARIPAEHEDALAVAEACGHLPLAVRIAAERIAARPNRTIGDLAGRLADEGRRLRELRLDGLTLEAAFQAGYRQLSADQARALRVLAAMTSPDASDLSLVSDVSLVAAATVLDMARDTAEDLLESLVDAALLRSPRAGRYRLHSLVRCFALHRAAEDGGTDTDGLGRLLCLPVAG